MRSRILVGLIALGLLVGLSVSGAVADAQPVVGRLKLPWPYTFLVQGQYVYVLSRANKDNPTDSLSIVDAAQPEAPVLVGQTEVGDVGMAFDVDAGYLYAVEDDGISIFDVSVPTNPHRVGHAFVEDHFPGGVVKVVDDYLYLSHSENLWVFDVSDPTQPVRIATLSNVNGIMYADPPHLYAVDNSLTDVDISDPTHPVILSQTSLSYDVIRSAYDVRTKHLYYWNEPFFELPVFAVVDVTNPQPRILRREVENPPLVALLDHGLLYAVARPELEVYSLTRPEQPVLIGTVPYPVRDFYAATVKDDVAYVLKDDGLYTFRLPHFLPFKSYLSALEVLKGDAG